ncbi:MAG TPA: hypothetical protein VFH69_02180, partial [Gemmatimonadota bacterium]|nr:hypothetical protein [Gemmatimonadota bacterium]
GLDSAVERLAAHGVRMLTVVEPVTIEAEAFSITSSSQSEREFQQHKERTLEGRWEPVRETVPVGTVLVPTSQPLGRLAFYLLDPRSDDGLVAWNVLDEALEGAARYPILRAASPPPDGSYREWSPSDTEEVGAPDR